MLQPQLPCCSERFWGDKTGHPGTRPGALAGVGTVGSRDWTLLDSANTCLFSRADASCLFLRRGCAEHGKQQ